ncbi:hypothetical protein Gotri_003798 [Gossypium trilobum]|uniref:Uncharacterized protein n=1 Tax=Gossypium trilobum TaxID=34281 RepID=A0A7J9F2Z0_9ROSI|nr:hypothetical protein [Gossypium trilobum]
MEESTRKIEDSEWASKRWDGNDKSRPKCDGPQFGGCSPCRGGGEEEI